MNGKLLITQKEAGRYRYLKCCEGQRSCEDYPIFSVYTASDKKFSGEFAAKPNDLDFIVNWLPRPNSEVGLPEEFEKPDLEIEHEHNQHSHRHLPTTAGVLAPASFLDGQANLNVTRPPNGPGEADQGTAGPDTSLRPQRRPADLNTRITAVDRSLRPQVRPANLTTSESGFEFPVYRRPQRSFWTGMRRFGARRRAGRKHAGCDLYRRTNDRVRAIRSGRVLRKRYFYLGTYALEIRIQDGSVYIYGEVSGRSVRGVSRGQTITKGQHIAYIGDLRGISQSMLHFEQYTGSATGSLTQ
ncbi:MAG: M23 family metallopeptidase, partial [Bdellovibrionales bacterium]|nr:M23 family metallopeptidase [Bdellovibrionales bacterium]